jgi:adenylate cyclase
VETLLDGLSHRANDTEGGPTTGALWLAYIPQYVAEDLLRRPGESPLGPEQRFEVVALFADVSGFTQMSEALGKAGRRGAEELTLLLNGYFEPMTDLIQSYGGIIGKFGGDAMTVLFPYEESTRVATTRRAIQCALDMQAMMPRFAAIPTSAGAFSLGMKAGLALGPVLCVTIGDPVIRLEYIIAGSVLNLCAQAEHHALRGEVVVHNDLLSVAGPLDILEQRGTFSCVADLRPREPLVPLPPLPDVPADVIASVAAFVHPAIARRIRAGQVDFVNEHRKVTALFANIGEFDYDHDHSVGATLQEYLSAVIRTVHRYDGFLSRVDMGDKGSKCLILFGAPVIHEDDEERAIQCALDLRALSALFIASDTAIRIGISTGFMYCGHVGSAARREYTVMGDAVILAVRLMQVALPGQILVGDETRRNLGATFAWETLEAIRVKGWSSALTVHVAHGRSQHLALRLPEPVYTLPMIGRERELALASEVIERVVGGRGQILSIVAEPGVGKSRLSAEIAKLAAAHGCVCYGGASQSYGTRTSYLVWHDIWRGFFGLDSYWPLGAQERHLKDHLAVIGPALVQRLPLLGVVLNSTIPDNDLTRSLDTQLRQDLLKSLLLACLRQRAGAAPLLFVLEDCHWIDPLSLELLEFLGRNMADLAVLIVVVHRPLDDEQHPLCRILRFAHAAPIDLAELAPAEAARLIALKLAQRYGIEAQPHPVSAEQALGDVDGPHSMLVERIAARAQGNPFYIEEIVNFVHDRGIDPSDPQAVQGLDLPDSLHALILSRIDQLGAGEQVTLKAASVLGRLFKAAWLWGSYPQLGAPESVRQHLDVLSRLDLTPLDKPEPELEYLFKHITTQEVAYESLPFTLRAAMHAQVGQFIERSYPDDLAQYVNVLAHHYGRSNNVARQRVYFRRAGDAAKAAYANQVAIDYYQRLLPLLGEAEQGEVQRELGEIWQLTGKWREAEQAYRQALALAEAAGDRGAQARCQAALGYLLSYTESYQDALIWLERAREGFGRLGDLAGLIRALEYLSHTHIQQGNYLAALAYSEEQIRIAMEYGDLSGVSIAAENIGRIYWYQGEHTRALAHYEQAIDAAGASGDRRARLHALSDMAGVYWSRGDYGPALVSLRKALQEATEIGYLHLVGLIVGNAGEIYRQQKDYERALICYAQGLRVVVELGDWMIICSNIGNIATVYTAQGRYREAEQLYMRAIAVERGLNIPYYLCDDLYRLALLYMLQRRYADALPINQEALNIAAQVTNREIQFQAACLAIRLDVLAGQAHPQTAVAQFEKLLEEWLAETEQAAAHYEIWRLDPARERSYQEAVEGYRRLYERTTAFEYRQRYEELTGDRLADPPELPPLSDSLARSSLDLDGLLDQVERLSRSVVKRTTSPTDAV